MSVKIASFFASIFLLSCSDTGNEGLPQVTMHTDDVSYSVGQPISIATSNGLAEMIILSPCCSRPDFRIQQRVTGNWTPAGECLLMCPGFYLPLSSGSRRIDTVNILAAGYYRIMLRYQNQRTLQTDSTYSNEFTVQ